MQNLKIILCILCICYSVAPVVSQENDVPEDPVPGIRSERLYIPRYEEGNGSISVGLGVLAPLFFQRFSGEYADTRLSAGGTAWLEWNLFVWKALAFGMEINGMFSLSTNMRFLLLAPITAHLKYIFQAHPIEFPVSLGLGVSLVSFEDNFKVDIVLKPKIGVAYRINQNWAVGIFGSYYLDFQIYDYSLGPQYSRMANFFEASVGFYYVF